MLLTLMILFTSIIKVQTCSTLCPSYQFKNFEDRREFITHLSNSSKISKLALVGTHYSASYKIKTLRYKTQNLKITEQLNYGVRVLDIGIRAISNKFALHMQGEYLKLMFENVVLKKVDNFLRANPKELVIMLMHQDHYPASGVTLSNCKILNQYRSLEIGSRISTNWSLDDTIEQHRGKILLASSDQSFSNCSMNINVNCKVQYDPISADSKSPILDKWIAIRRLQEESFLNDRGNCFINFMSEHKNATSSNDFTFYEMAVDGYYTKEFGCLKPINYLMTKYFDSSYRSLMIVMADFVVQDLIDRVIGSNFEEEYYLTGYNGSFPLSDSVFYYLEFIPVEV